MVTVCGSYLANELLHMWNKHLNQQNLFRISHTTYEAIYDTVNLQSYIHTTCQARTYQPLHSQTQKQTEPNFTDWHKLYSTRSSQSCSYACQLWWSSIMIIRLQLSSLSVCSCSTTYVKQLIPFCSSTADLSFTHPPYRREDPDARRRRPRLTAAHGRVLRGRAARDPGLLPQRRPRRPAAGQRDGDARPDRPRRDLRPRSRAGARRGDRDWGEGQGQRHHLRPHRQHRPQPPERSLLRGLRRGTVPDRRDRHGLDRRGAEHRGRRRRQALRRQQPGGSVRRRRVPAARRRPGRRADPARGLLPPLRGGREAGRRRDADVRAQPRQRHLLLRERARHPAVLEKDWGFKGIVLADYGAAVDTGPSLTNGLDFEPSGLSETTTAYMPAQIQAALAAGMASESDVDLHVQRMLRTMFAYGMFDRAAYVDDGRTDRQDRGRSRRGRHRGAGHHPAEEQGLAAPAHVAGEEHRGHRPLRRPVRDGRRVRRGHPVPGHHSAGRDQGPRRRRRHGHLRGRQRPDRRSSRREGRRRRGRRGRRRRERRPRQELRRPQLRHRHRGQRDRPEHRGLQLRAGGPDDLPTQRLGRGRPRHRRRRRQSAHCRGDGDRCGRPHAVARPGRCRRRSLVPGPGGWDGARPRPVRRRRPRRPPARDVPRHRRPAVDRRQHDGLPRRRRRGELRGGPLRRLPLVRRARADARVRVRQRPLVHDVRLLRADRGRRHPGHAGHRDRHRDGDEHRHTHRHRGARALPEQACDLGAAADGPAAGGLPEGLAGSRRVSHRPVSVERPLVRVVGRVKGHGRRRERFVGGPGRVLRRRGRLVVAGAAVDRADRAGRWLRGRPARHGRADAGEPAAAGRPGGDGGAGVGLGRAGGSGSCTRSGKSCARWHRPAVAAAAPERDGARVGGGRAAAGGAAGLKDLRRTSVAGLAVPTSTRDGAGRRAARPPARRAAPLDQRVWARRRRHVARVDDRQGARDEAGLPVVGARSLVADPRQEDPQPSRRRPPPGVEHVLACREHDAPSEPLQAVPLPCYDAR